MTVENMNRRGTTYSFCERVWAGPQSPWHIRRLSSAGRKLGGGIDTPSLCGRIVPPEGKGCDLDVKITPHHLTHACKACVAAYRTEPGEPRCDVTTNPCGTDTWPVGKSCECASCQAWLKTRQSTFEFGR